MKAVQLVCGLALFIYLPSLGQTKHFVKQTAAGTGTGLGSWANAAGAAQLQGILAAAASGDTVWIAAGVYYPTAYPAGSTGGATNRDFAFALTNGVAVYGGFAGTESFLSQRNVATHVTSLSGDIGTVGNVTDNCYHVIATYNMSNTAILDGVKIDSGEANGTGSITIGGQAFSRATGAGICAMKSQPTLANCTFIANQASGEGAALYLGNCNAFPVTSCAFTSNTAQGNGGAISKETSSPVTFSGCTFTGNYSFVAAGTTGGGAIYSNSGSGDVIQNCVFTGNHAGNANGGAFFFNGTSTLTMSYTTLTQNVAATYGGGMANTGGTSFTITHCNFNNNNASMGGGIYGHGDPAGAVAGAILCGWFGRATLVGGGPGGQLRVDAVFRWMGVLAGGVVGWQRHVVCGYVCGPGVLLQAGGHAGRWEHAVERGRDGAAGPGACAAATESGRIIGDAVCVGAGECEHIRRIGTATARAVVGDGK